MKRVLFILGLLCLALPAQAQVNLPILGKAIASSSTPCSPTSCTGPYVGAFMAGNGTNADIIGSGLNGSVFAGGGIPGVAAGYQFANGTWFLAAEAGIGDQINVGSSVNGVGSNETGFMAYEVMKVGGQLSGLLGNTSSITIPSTLTAQLISPYVQVGGVERTFANGWAVGAGATFDISTHLFLDINYKYVTYPANTTVGGLALANENIVQVGLNYKF